MSSHAATTSSEITLRQILVIDDSALVREAAKIALGRIGGWQVITADSGEQGISQALSQRPDAILLDVVMPGMDGIAVAEALNGMPSLRSVPILLLTADDRIESSESFRLISVAGVINKPFDIAGLSREVTARLGWEL
jgi:two-component system, OmpR family, alkaline phosphatase synthesis response regulator PhoP